MASSSLWRGSSDDALGGSAGGGASQQVHLGQRRSPFSISRKPRTAGPRATAASAGVWIPPTPPVCDTEAPPATLLLGSIAPGSSHLRDAAAVSGMSGTASAVLKVHRRTHHVRVKRGIRVGGAPRPAVLFLIEMCGAWAAPTAGQHTALPSSMASFETAGLHSRSRAWRSRGVH